MEMYSNEQNPVDYSVQFERAVQYGDDGRNLDTMKGSKEFGALTPEQIEAAYAIGKDKRTVRNKKLMRKSAAGVSVGNVDTSGIDMSMLNKHQRTAVHTVGRLAKVVGFNVKFVESKGNAKGEYTTDNGQWDSRTLTLTLDIHAGSNTKTDTDYAMMHTVGHELTHYIRQFADTDLWNGYQEFVIGHLSTKENATFNLEDRIQRHVEKARKDGRNLTRDGAVEEIIADASGEALNSITEEDVQALSETNPGLLDKIKQFFKRWINSVKAAVKAAYSGTEAKTEEARMMQDVADEMGKRWNELFVNAAKNRAVASETTIEGVELSESGETAYAGDGLLYDLPVAHDVVRDFVREKQEQGKAQKSDAGDVKYSLREYSEQQKANWSTSKKIVLYQDEKQAIQFVNDALAGKNLEKKMFFGMVPEALARRIMKEAGYSRDITGYNVCIHAKEIRKINKKHGNEHRESLMGQRAIIAKDYVVIPETVEHADTIYMSPDKYMGLDVLMFERTVDGSKTTLVAVVGNGNLDLFVQTMYASAKKENLADAADAFAPAITSETTYGTVLDSSLSQDEPIVKMQERNYSTLSDREILVQALESDLTDVERGHLKRYKEKLDELSKKQDQLEALNRKISELKAAGYTVKTSEELRVAQTNAQTLRNSINRADAKLN